MWGGVGIPRLQWVMTVAIAFGLVVMHHLVSTHTDHMTSATMASAGHAHHNSVLVNPVGTASTSMAAQASCCDPMGMAGHFCLAVLTAITIFVAALIFAFSRRQPMEPGNRPATASSAAARAPPVGCDRLARLCVLRC